MVGLKAVGFWVEAAIPLGITEGWNVEMRRRFTPAQPVHQSPKHPKP